MFAPLRSEEEIRMADQLMVAARAEKLLRQYGVFTTVEAAKFGYTIKYKQDGELRKITAFNAHVLWNLVNQLRRLEDYLPIVR